MSIYSSPSLGSTFRNSCIARVFHNVSSKRGLELPKVKCLGEQTQLLVTDLVASLTPLTPKVLSDKEQYKWVLLQDTGHW